METIPMLKRSLLLVLLASALTAFAAPDPPFTITPDRGPVAGGTLVTIRGEFGGPAYRVMFGHSLVNATLVNPTTLTAVTPAHLPQTVTVTIVEGSNRFVAQQRFTFEGDADTAFVPLLLPVYTGPIRGAFGSEFHTSFRAELKGNEQADIYGLTLFCHPVGGGCLHQPDIPYTLTPAEPEISTDSINLNVTGRPGALLYVPKEHAGRLAMNLRAFDISRAAENFGTELPVVRGEKFTHGLDQSITLVGIPSDPRFRNTLRIYSRGEFDYPLSVEIDSDTGFHAIHMVYPEGGGTLFTPGYAQFSNFPVNQGTLHVTIRLSLPPISALLPPADLWALVSVTNNETQHITTITPQP
jgi:hypothetical protein